ncbi:MAG: hypothetical protein IJ597_01220 [Synergistaceae bacterium]|nr:hypothetical protein [Synergistaceae bacterium]
MPLILTWNNSGGSGGNVDTSELTNLSTLKKLSTTSDGKLAFNGKTVGEQGQEVTHYETLMKNQKSIELPNDCDTTQAITVSINGLAVDENTFWEVIEKSSPEKDLIAWEGLGLETLAQEGDKILITYYRKV